MAKSSSTSALPIPSPVRPLHKRFSWLNRDQAENPDALFAELTLDVCQGIETCLDIVMEAQLAEAHNKGFGPGENVSSLLGPAGTERLLRLALVSSRMLALEADRRIDGFNDMPAQGGQ